MSNKINFTQEELQLLYVACMSYGDKLSNIAKDIFNESFLINELAGRAEKSWNLAVKIAKCMEE